MAASDFTRLSVVIPAYNEERFIADLLGKVLAVDLSRFGLDREVIVTLRTTGFELDHEITSKVLGRGHTIREVPIRYYPRSREEGKKIGARDWFIAVRTYWRYGRTGAPSSAGPGHPADGPPT